MFESVCVLYLWQDERTSKLVAAERSYVVAAVTTDWLWLARWWLSHVLWLALVRISVRWLARFCGLICYTLGRPLCRAAAAAAANICVPISDCLCLCLCVIRFGSHAFPYHAEQRQDTQHTQTHTTNCIQMGANVRAWKLRNVHSQHCMLYTLQLFMLLGSSIERTCCILSFLCCW